MARTLGAGARGQDQRHVGDGTSYVARDIVEGEEGGGHLHRSGPDLGDENRQDGQGNDEACEEKTRTRGHWAALHVPGVARLPEEGQASGKIST